MSHLVLLAYPTKNRVTNNIPIERSHIVIILSDLCNAITKILRKISVHRQLKLIIFWQLLHPSSCRVVFMCTGYLISKTHWYSFSSTYFLSSTNAALFSYAWLFSLGFSFMKHWVDFIRFHPWVSCTIGCVYGLLVYTTTCCGHLDIWIYDTHRFIMEKIFISITDQRCIFHQIPE